MFLLFITAWGMWNNLYKNISVQGDNETFNTTGIESRINCHCLIAIC